MSFLRSCPLVLGGLSILMACGPSSPSGSGDAGDAGHTSDAKIDVKADAPSASGFQPSNITMAAIMKQAPMAVDEDVENASCGLQTLSTNLGSFLCFTSPLVKSTEVIDGQSQDVALLVVKSLKVGTMGAVSVAGDLPLILVSLGDITIESGGSIQAYSANALDVVGPDGAASQGNASTKGTGPGGGPAGSVTNYISGGGGSFCGKGGAGGGSSAQSPTYGSADIRPLIGGSSGGAGDGAPGGSGSGGGAIQIVAMGTLTVSTNANIVAGGGGASSCITSACSAGGSGGAILLESPTVTIAGLLEANGGGGGSNAAGGADTLLQATAAAGGEAMSGTAAPGGNGSAGATTSGSPGGAGTASSTNLLGSVSGGGGGGAGWIRINSTHANLAGSVQSPSSASCFSQGPLRTASAGP
jgi:hypothetical protein